MVVSKWISILTQLLKYVHSFFNHLSYIWLWE